MPRSTTAYLRVVCLGLGSITLALAVVWLLVVVAPFSTLDPDRTLQAAGIASGLLIGVALVHFAYAQLRHAHTMRMLDTMPVLTPWYEDRGSSGRPGVVMLDNCGRGPAMDIRAYVFRPGVGPPIPPQFIFTVVPEKSRSHLGPHDGELKLQAVPTPLADDVTWSDVWVIHCGDLNGDQWHAWSNLTRKGIPRRGEPFIFESHKRTAQWILDYCPRCGEIEKLRKGEEARE